MTARAFLGLADELRQAFAAAQDDDTLRFLRVEIANGETLTNVCCLPKGRDVQSDFDSLAQEVSEATPCLFLMSLDAAEVKLISGKGGSSARQWLLVAWIPDDSKVRDKMLYSSSKQDIRQGLGLGFFEGEYYANVPGDLTFESLVSSRRSGSGDQLLSEAELLKRDLNKQERASDAGMKSAAMGVIPFTIREDLRQRLDDFNLAKDGVNWIEMRMDGEHVALAAASMLAETESLQDSINEAEPRFYLMRREGSKFLIYSCPEEAAVRLKMTYSSSKASVVSAAAEAGVTVDHMVEVNSPHEIDEAVAQALCDAMDPGSRGGTTGGERGSISSSAPAVSRPSRPGRGRARLTKRS